MADCAPSSPGTVVCSGADNNGYANTPGESVGVSVITGATINSGGILITGPGDSGIVNSGNINGSLSGTVAGVAMSNMSIYATGNTNFTIDQNGNINQNIGVDGTTGTNTLIVRPGHSVNTVAMDGADNVLDNAGIFNSSLTLTADPGGQNVITNRAGAQLNTITINGEDTLIDNAGTINQSITQNGAGTFHIINREGAVISGLIDTSSIDSADRIDNAGTINSGATLGGGNDYFVNRAGGTSGDDPPVANGNIDMGAGNDTFIMADGTINGDILLGEGVDVAGIAGGRITRSVHGQGGNDYILWSGGTVASGLFGEGGNDSAIFSNLTSVNLTPGLVIDGGDGTDRMAWQNTQNAAGGQGTNVDTIRNWELIALARNAELTFEFGSDTLVLGDAGTLTGQLILDDETARVVASSPNDHTVRAFSSGSRVTVSNAGTIDMVTGSPTELNRFIVMGDYIGNEGTLALQIFLDTDSDTRSDQLVINGANGGGSGTGVTSLAITNFGGPGAQTNANGILVVDAQNAATTNPGSFSLAGPVAAGIFEYQLFQGGIAPDAATDSDWFLRSSVATVPPPPIPVDPPPITPTVPPLPPIVPVPPEPPPVPPQPPVPVDPTPVTPTVPPLPPEPPSPPEPPPLPPVDPPVPITPTAPPLIDPEIPLIRPEIPGYTLAPSIVQRMGIVALDTFHQRRGDQSLLDSYGEHPAVWGRLFGQSYERDWDSAVDGMDYVLAPSFDGHIFGIQAGLDLFGKEHDGGSQDRVALFFTHTRAKGDVSGNVLAEEDVRTGEVNLNGTSLGVNWTHVGAAGWYVDAIAMGTVLGGDVTSDRGIGADMAGHALLVSLEGGYPLALDEDWTLEPQAQIVWQRVDLDDTDDGFSGIDYEATDSFTGRLGLRLEGNTTLGGRPVQPFASVNLWHEFSDDHAIVFNDESVTMATGGTTLEIQGGLSAQWNEKVSLYGSLGYMTSVADEDFDGFSGNLGLRVKWQ